MVWIAASDSPTDESDTSDDIADPDERAVVLVERMSDAVGRQITGLLSALERSEERNRSLEREGGQKQERIEALERVVDTVRQMSDADRQLAGQLQAERDAALARLEAAETERDRLRERSWWERLWDR